MFHVIFCRDKQDLLESEEIPELSALMEHQEKTEGKDLLGIVDLQDHPDQLVDPVAEDCRDCPEGKVRVARKVLKEIQVPLVQPVKRGTKVTKVVPETLEVLEQLDFQVKMDPQEVKAHKDPQDFLDNEVQLDYQEDPDSLASPE